MIYLSPTANIDPWPDNFGLILSARQPGSIYPKLESGVPWLLDNGVFTKKYNETNWLNQMTRYKLFADTCVGVAVPDVLYNSKETLILYKEYSPKIPLCYRRLIVTQDGMFAKDIPWQDIDGVFVGGSNEHKLNDSFGIVSFAHTQNKHVHVGRVNSLKRMKRVWFADTVDGTTLVFEWATRDVKAQKFSNLADKLRSKQRDYRLFNGYCRS